MVFQSGGHQEANASMTICSRDIKDLTPEQEEELREALRSAGSPLIGMLPTKDEIDKACWDMVTVLMQITEELMKIKIALIPSEHTSKAQDLPPAPERYGGR
uniref:hypothetical protein n=1 Tax=Vibrio cholerae TaxID=666 RepID=UPI003F58FEA9